jgi:aminoglycoside/choline kinase family phosphotransferase
MPIARRYDTEKRLANSVCQCKLMLWSWRAIRWGMRYGGGMSLESEQLAWVGAALQCEASKLSVRLIAGDASPRRYYRVAHSAQEDSATTIFVTSPPSENNQAFVSIGALLARQGARVPHVLASDVEAGWFLLEDFGDVLLLERLTPGSADALYGQALNVLRTVQSNTDGWACVPSYDAARLQQELDVFPEWFLASLLALPGNATDDSGFAALCSVLRGSALAQPQVLVHRDFHCRNLMCLNDGSIGVIDFQDAVIGPITYDPVSLLKDCYVEWPRAQQLRWLAGFVEQATLDGNARDTDMSQWIEWFDLMGLQRHLKVLGVFSRLALRDDKPGYVRDIPLVVRYIEEVLALYTAHPEVSVFSKWWDRTIAPALNDWDNIVRRAASST